MYQLLAYTVALNLPTGILVYAANGAEGTDFFIPEARKWLAVRSLSLDGSPEQILSEVRKIAFELTAIAVAA